MAPTALVNPAKRRKARSGMAEGAGFEPAAHGVGAGFQDRWFQPLTHPSDKDFNNLGADLFDSRIRVAAMLQYPESFRNVGALHVYLALMHLEGTVAGRRHRRLRRDSFSNPCGFCTVA